MQSCLNASWIRYVIHTSTLSYNAQFSKHIITCNENKNIMYHWSICYQPNSYLFMQKEAELGLLQYLLSKCFCTIDTQQTSAYNLQITSRTFDMRHLWLTHIHIWRSTLTGAAAIYHQPIASEVNSMQPNMLNIIELLQKLNFYIQMCHKAQISGPCFLFVCLFGFFLAWTIYKFWWVNVFTAFHTHMLIIRHWQAYFVSWSRR